jgi:glycogen debranching enzyme
MDSPAEPLPRLARARDAGSRGFLEINGRRAALLGEERGVFECWIWPIKVFHGLALRARIVRADGSESEWVSASDLPGTVEVRPERVKLEYRHPLFRIQQTLHAALDRRALVMLLEIDCDSPMEIEIRLEPDFRPMWPAGFGGQITTRDPQTGAVVLTEELGRFAAIVGSPEALPGDPSADHGLPRDPVTLRIPIPLERMERGPIALFIAGAETTPAPLSAAARLGDEGAALGHARSAAVVALAREEYLETQRKWPELVAAHERHWREFLARTTAIETPNAQLDEAFLWAKIAIEKAWVEVDGLGLGLVAGLATSGSGERPGFGWFFDGDAMVAARAMLDYGDFEGALRVLEFAASHQRADGKLMHELTLSARLCNWVEDYPYAYYKGVNTPDFIAAVCEYAAATGDEVGTRRLLPHVKRAFEHCLACLDDDGLMSVRKAGLAAVEAGPLCGRIESDVFLHGLWMSALGELATSSVPALAKLRKRAMREVSRAHAAFNRFESSHLTRHGFARLTDGGLCDDLSGYLAQPLSAEPRLARLLMDSLEESDLAHWRIWSESLTFLNRPELASDWGLRLFATDASVYDPAHYNTGSVFPYLSQFAMRALIRLDVAAVWQLLRSQVNLHGFSGLGFVPEHLRGDRAIAPERGVPHQVFSSATIVLGIKHVALGVSRGGSGLCLDLYFPPEWRRVAVRNYRIGESRLDFDLTRERARHRTIHSWRFELRGGPPVRIHLAPQFDPEVGVETVDGVPGAGAEFRLGQTKEVRVESRSPPELLVEVAPLTLGRESADLRISDCERWDDEPGVTWTVWGRAGRTYRARVFCDRELEIAGAQRVDGSAPWSEEGAQLQIRMPPGDPASFVMQQIRVVPETPPST